MPMSLPAARRLAPLLVLLLALSVVCVACGVARQASPSREPMSGAAASTYDYLRFQALSQEMARTGALSRTSPEAFARTLELQKSASQAIDRVLALGAAPGLFMDKAFLYWNPEQAGEARAILDAGLKLFPDDYNLNASAANSFLLENKMPEAAARIDAYLVKHDNTTLRERLGQLYIDTDQSAKGLEVLRKIPLKDRSSDAQFQMARAQARLGHRKAAIETLSRLVKKSPDFLEAWVELAFQQETEKDYASALATYTQILALGESHEDIRQRIENGGGEGREDIRLRVVGLELKLNDPDKALMVALDGSGNTAFVLSASLLFLSENYTAQASTLLDVLASTPPVPGEYFFYKAVIAQDGENNPVKALQFLDLVPQSDAHYSQALQFRIQLLYGLGREHEAVALMEQGKRLFPGQSRFPLLQANYLISKKRVPEAIELLKTALEARPEDEDLLYQYGAALDRQEDRTGALEVMQRIVDKNPEHADALNYIGYTLVEEHRDLERALSLIRKADRLKPNNGYIVDSLAWAYYRLGRLDEAWRQIQRAVTLAQDDPTMWEHYGDIARDAGYRAKAKKGYKAALKLKHETPERVQTKLKGL